MGDTIFNDLVEIQPDPDVPEGWVGLKTEGGDIVFFDLGQTVVNPEWAATSGDISVDMQRAISKAVNNKMKRERDFVEDRILAGYDRVVTQSGDKRYVYEVPSWRTQFQSRLRVQWGRFKYEKEK